MSTGNELRKTRRALLSLGAATIAVAGLGGPLARGIGRELDRGLGVSGDLLLRIRRRTRPFDPASIDKPHGLVG